MTKVTSATANLAAERAIAELCPMSPWRIDTCGVPWSRIVVSFSQPAGRLQACPEESTRTISRIVVGGLFGPLGSGLVGQASTSSQPGSQAASRGPLLLPAPMPKR